ncbi:PepSY domain-containing protein [Micromonospora avicenniae]|uniref:PepSY domain-containing protein n=1 Tax=Micromonospora avicenniae TaxID=1198245 RepID=UPI00343AA102
MKRSSMLLASAGGAAVLAVAGVAIGATVADDRRDRDTTLAAATTAPTAPDDSATSGTPDDSAGTGAPSTTAGTPSGAPSSSGAPAGGTGGDRIGPQRAGEIALARAGGGRITEIEAEQEHGRPVWSVEIVSGDVEHDIDVDRDNGAVLRAEREQADDDDD